MNEQELAGLKKAIDDQSNAMAVTIESQSKEVKELGASTKATADKLEAQGKALDQMRADLDGKLEQMKAENAKRDGKLEAWAEAQKAFGRPPAIGGSDSAPQKSLGEAFVEMLKAKPDMMSALREGTVKRSDGVAAKEFNFPAARLSVREKSIVEGLLKANITSDLATRFVAPFRDAMLPAIQKPLRLSDLMNRRPIGVNGFEYIEWLGMGPNTGVSVTLAQSAGTATATVASTAKIKPMDRVLISGANQTEYNGVQTVLTVPSSTTFTFDVDSGATSPATGTILYRNLSRHGAAAVVAEGAVKPEGYAVPTLREGTCKTIAHNVPIAKQIFDDLPELETIVNGELTYGVDLEQERQLLYGDGSTEMQGILTNANVQTIVGISSQIKLELLRKAATKASRAGYPANVALVGPEDMEDIELASGTDGHYLWASASAASGPAAVWRLSLLESAEIQILHGLVGSFNPATQTLYDREQANVQISDQHSDFFTRNLLCLRGEARVGVAWKRPEAFVFVDFAAAVRDRP